MKYAVLYNCCQAWMVQNSPQWVFHGLADDLPEGSSLPRDIKLAEAEVLDLNEHKIHYNNQMALILSL